jgi:hypothetical protein
MIFTEADMRNERDELQSDDEISSVESDSVPNFFGSAKDVIDRYSHCALCGSHLHFTHMTDFTRNLTQETSKCPECGVKARQNIHRLQ